MNDFITYRFWKQFNNIAIYVSECGGVATISILGLYFPKEHFIPCPAMIAKKRPAYPSIHFGFWENGLRTTYNFYLHRAVAEVYLRPKNIFEIEVDHLDGNIMNYHVLNLEWVTHEENIRRRWEAYYKRKGASAHTDIYAGGGSPQKGGVSK